MDYNGRGLGGAPRREYPPGVPYGSMRHSSLARYSFSLPGSHQQRYWDSNSYQPSPFHPFFSYRTPESIPSGQGSKYQQRYWDSNSYQPSPAHPFFSYRTPESIPSGNRAFQRSLGVSPVGFYSVKVLPSENFGRNFLLASISDKLGRTLLPFRSVYSHESLRFFVNDHLTAKELAKIDGKIHLPDCSLLRVYVKAASPSFLMDDDTMQAITHALNTRYDPATKAADLSDFQNNPHFTGRGLICSLNLPSALVRVTDILMTLAPDLVELDLEWNSLTSLEEAGSALPRFRCLRVLNLAGNKIRGLEEIAHLSALNLAELDLRGNILPRKFRYRWDYVRAIQELLPSLKVLDGDALAQEIRFDLPESATLPEWFQSHVPGSSANFAQQFLTQYYAFYDETGRPRLTAAYHKAAVMSMICYVPTAEGVSYSMMSSYHPHNRNFMLSGMRDPRVYPLLFRGPNQIVDCFRKLPPSKHQFETFSCDVVIFSDDVIQISVSGLFEELGSKPNVSGEPLKNFHRCFVLAKVPNGYLIVNDSLVIRYPTATQMKTCRDLKKSKEAPESNLDEPTSTVDESRPCQKLQV